MKAFHVLTSAAVVLISYQATALLPAGPSNDIMTTRSAADTVNFQHYLVITKARGRGATASIRGELLSVPRSDFLIQFFSTRLVSSLRVTTDDQGVALFSKVLSPVSADQYITAKATLLNAEGHLTDISEWSAPVQISPRA